MRSGSWLLSRSGFAGLSLAFVLWAPGVKADAIQSAPGLTDISFQLRVKTNAASSYAAVTHPEKWWNGEHSYSGDVSNMTLEAVAGGCWCEKLDNGGSVQHLQVVYVAPGRALRLRGAARVLQYILSPVRDIARSPSRYIAYTAILAA